MGVNSLAVRAVVGVLTMMGGIGFMGIAEGSTWCVAVSSATAKALQAALDYACGPGGADCVPIQIDGLCYLPNSLAAHASYAFNSCFQRSGQAPGSCDFAGTATTSITDPSYGSCTYPSSRRNAGGSMPSSPNESNNTNTPEISPLTPSIGGANGGFTPGFGPPSPFTDDTSWAPPQIQSILLYAVSLYFFLLVF
ncbi:Glucan endo-1,3-beta-D-glucosidase protein [Dioscorea alata]|uniref:Glucan endo-1,3-beta-D-glucosidase protein n=1 Tax=Dioscorea alata TaxID=55571 RepID=A0ACB7V9X3_DIOAL|nr:Glucan endo-1,3-beta-D-glucosidase protein [Dioscorea alata]